ncbi:MAG TPA: hypothetical protein PK760_12040, partial [Flavobacteriales bacterium]|nr:hypothetical protein [Flavobacteriales bacterium]
MKKLIALLSILVIAIQTNAQHSGRVAENIEMLRSAGVQFPTRNLFTGVQRSMQNDSRWVQTLANAAALRLDQAAINSIGTERPSYFALELPTSEGGTMILDLEYTEITTADFSVVQASTNAATAYTPGAHYRG